MHKPIDDAAAVGFDPDVAELNQRYAFVIEHGKAVIFREDTNEKGHIHITRMTVQDFKAKFSNRSVIDGKRTVQLGKYWLEHPDRRSYESCGFDPDPERPHDPLFYNLFQGFPIEPVAGNCSHFKKHLFEVGANGDQETYDYIMQWLALLVQMPHKMPLSAIVFQGKQGTGKGTIVKWIGELVGKHYMHVANVKHVVGNFNAHLQDCLLLFADEAVWAGDKASEGTLKAIVTEPTLVLERKGRDAHLAKNHTHLIIATNNEWAVPMEASDRRFIVVNVPDTYAANPAYFKAIEDEMTNGGIQALMWELMNADVVYPLRKPKSINSIESAWRQQEQALTPFHTWLLARLEDGHQTRKVASWQTLVPKADLYDDYLSDMKALNIQRRLASNVFSKDLTRILPGVVSTRTGPRAQRAWAWTFPELAQCREMFAKHFQKPTAAIFPPELPDEGSFLD